MVQVKTTRIQTAKPAQTGPIARTRIARIAIVVVVLMGFGAYFLLRKPGPDQVAHVAANALCDHDVDTLLDLTLPEEKTRLHITREALKGVLDETIWGHTLPQRLIWPPTRDYASDEISFYAMPQGRSGSLTFPLVIVVTKSPDGRWRLATSNLLLHCCRSSLAQGDPHAASSLFGRLMDKYGILGVRLNSTGYQMFSDMRQPPPPQQ